MNINRQRLFLAISSVVGIIAVFLPWETVSVLGVRASQNGLEYTVGIIALIVFAGALALSLLGGLQNALDGMYKTIIAGLGAVAFVIGLFAVLTFGNEVLSTGFGVYLATIAGAAVAAFAYFFEKIVKSR